MSDTEKLTARIVELERELNLERGLVAALTDGLAAEKFDAQQLRDALADALGVIPEPDHRLIAQVRALAAQSQLWTEEELRKRVGLLDRAAKLNDIANTLEGFLASNRAADRDSLRRCILGDNARYASDVVVRQIAEAVIADYREQASWLRASALTPDRETP